MSGETLPRLRCEADLDEPGLVHDAALQVHGARVVFADYERLCRDFPHLAEGGESPRDRHRRIDRWLVEHGALLSRRQVEAGTTNTPVATGREVAPVFRLPRGGRAFIAPVEGGLLDLKGVGVGPGATPRRGNFNSHCDGLLALERALEEVLRQRLVEAVLRHAGARVRGLPWYAVLDLGTDLLLADGGRYPAGVLVRRAHRRNRGNEDLPLHGSRQQEELLALELLLRRYGISSTNPGSSFEFEEDGEGRVTCRFAGRVADGCTERQLQRFWSQIRRAPRMVFRGVNIQTTRFDDGPGYRLVDFGHYVVRSRFHNHLLSTVTDRPFLWGGTLDPESPDYVQPDPAVAIPAAAWEQRRWPPEVLEPLGYREGTTLSDQQLLCARLVRGFRSGALEGGEVDRRISAFVASRFCPQESAGAVEAA